MSDKPRPPALARRSVDQLLGDYRAAAFTHGQASEAGDSRRCNRAHDRLSRIRHELARRGSDATERLLELLEDDDLSVRVWAAAEALSFAPERGLPVLREAAAGPRGVVRLGAAMVLQRWDAGEWTPIP